MALGLDVWGVRHFFFFVEPGNVIIRQLHEGVQRDNVVNIHGHTARLRALGDAVQFVLVFGIDVRPQHIVRGFAEEIPIALGIVRVFELHGRERILDLGREQIAVLVADVIRRAGEMHVGPAAAFKSVRADEARIAPSGPARCRDRGRNHFVAAEQHVRRNEAEAECKRQHER